MDGERPAEPPVEIPAASDGAPWSGEPTRATSQPIADIQGLEAGSPAQAAVQYATLIAEALSVATLVAASGGDAAQFGDLTTSCLDASADSSSFVGLAVALVRAHEGEPAGDAAVWALITNPLACDGLGTVAELPSTFGVEPATSAHCIPLWSSPVRGRVPSRPRRALSPVTRMPRRRRERWQWLLLVVAPARRQRMLRRSTSSAERTMPHALPDLRRPAHPNGQPRCRCRLRSPAADHLARTRTYRSTLRQVCWRIRGVVSGSGCVDDCSYGPSRCGHMPSGGVSIDLPVGEYRVFETDDRDYEFGVLSNATLRSGREHLTCISVEQ